MSTVRATVAPVAYVRLDFGRRNLDVTFDPSVSEWRHVDDMVLAVLRRHCDEARLASWSEDPGPGQRQPPGMTPKLLEARLNSVLEHAWRVGDVVV